MKSKKTKTNTNFFKPKVPRNVINLSWSQAKERFPLMKPYGDADKDKVKNFRDCKPFDIKRQGDEHDDEEISVGFDTIKKLKTVGEIQELDRQYKEW